MGFCPPSPPLAPRGLLCVREAGLRGRFWDQFQGPLPAAAAAAPQPIHLPHPHATKPRLPLRRENPAPKNALGGERKQVTVLFADLKGSMELLADRDPEEARSSSTRSSSA